MYMYVNTYVYIYIHTIYIYTPCIYIIYTPCIYIYVCVYIYIYIYMHVSYINVTLLKIKHIGTACWKKNLQLLGQYISTIQQVAPCIKGLPVPGKHGQRLQFLEMGEEARAHLSWDMVALADGFAWCACQALYWNWFTIIICIIHIYIYI